MSTPGIGRVPIAGDAPPPTPFFSRDDLGQPRADQLAAEATGRKLLSSGVSEVYFSERNVDALQDAIRYRVFVDSGGEHTIDRQSDVELAIIMRSVYLQESRNVETDVVAQVRQLNASVLDFCVPRIMQEIRGYLQHIDDISKLPVPIDRGQIATTKGDRTLVMFPGF
jgi:hypothetical protein